MNSLAKELFVGKFLSSVFFSLFFLLSCTGGTVAVDDSLADSANLAQTTVEQIEIAHQGDTVRLSWVNPEYPQDARITGGIVKISSYQGDDLVNETRQTFIVLNLGRGERNEISIRSLDSALNYRFSIMLVFDPSKYNDIKREITTKLISLLDGTDNKAEDSDNDSIADILDNCPLIYNPSQDDYDRDGTDTIANKEQGRGGDLCDNDQDNDTVLNDLDSCPLNSAKNWISNTSTDYDGDGCRNDEDSDQDNDTVLNDLDSCPLNSARNWISNASTDYDGDGCHNDEDDDQDNDKVLNDQDSCPINLARNWISNASTDYDGDGCRDDADSDLDNDKVLNDQDSCPINLARNWISNTSTDGDTDGCRDLEEDDFLDFAATAVNITEAVAISPRQVNISWNDPAYKGLKLKHIRMTYQGYQVSPRQEVSATKGSINISSAKHISISNLTPALQYEFNLTAIYESPNFTNGVKGRSAMARVIMPGDSDNDNIANSIDNCPAVYNPNQNDYDGDGRDPDALTNNNKGGDACDGDQDNDQVLNAQDSCPINLARNWISNTSTDYDGDGCRDDADSDLDNDKVLNDQDSCPINLARNWISNTSTDGDTDGCRDIDEDDFLDFAATAVNITGAVAISPRQVNISWNDPAYKGLNLEHIRMTYQGYRVSPRQEVLATKGFINISSAKHISISNLTPALQYEFNLTAIYESPNFTNGVKGRSAMARVIMPGDSDNDNIANSIDNCPAVYNPNQNDYDGDGRDPDALTNNNKGGDACDGDQDNDQVLNAQDSCPINLARNWISNTSTDYDGDGCRDDADSDLDNDKVLNDQDSCPINLARNWISNTSTDGDTDGCRDLDEDDFLDFAATAVNITGAVAISPRQVNISWNDPAYKGLNLEHIRMTYQGYRVSPRQEVLATKGSINISSARSISISNLTPALQYEFNLTAIYESPNFTNGVKGRSAMARVIMPGDSDNDNIANSIDNCPAVYNPNQNDYDGDGRDPDALTNNNKGGDACDGDQDNDQVLNAQDACPINLARNWISNASTDYDGDGCRDDADSDLDNDKVLNDQDSCPINLASNWISNASTDGDTDGCRDIDEDDFLDFAATAVNITEAVAISPRQVNISWNDPAYKDLGVKHINLGYQGYNQSTTSIVPGTEGSVNIASTTQVIISNLTPALQYEFNLTAIYDSPASIYGAQGRLSIVRIILPTDAGSGGLANNNTDTGDGGLANNNTDTDKDGGLANNNTDTDKDGLANNNTDTDKDGLANNIDNCPLFPNPAQTNSDGDGLGNECDIDRDGNGLIEIYNSMQLNMLRNNMEGSGLSQNPGEEGNSTGCGNGHNILLCSGYELMNDIDLSIDNSTLWKPIGESGNPFRALFDGNGHSITQLRLDYSKSFQGLFGYLGPASIINNLTIIPASTEFDNPGIVSSNEGNHIGTLVAYASGARISAIKVMNSTIMGADMVGGLVGFMENSHLSDSSIQGGSITGGEKVGGLVGSMQGGSIANALVNGKRVIGSKGEIGGLVGSAVDAKIRNIRAKHQQISGSARAGGLIGYMENGEIVNSYVEGELINGTREVGGFLGHANGVNREINMTSIAVKLNNITSSASRVGGLVGRAESTSIQLAYANISYLQGISDGGGLVGGLESSAIKHSYALIGSIQGDDKIGGLAGYIEDSSISYSYVILSKLASDNNAGGLVGYTPTTQSYSDRIVSSYWQDSVLVSFADGRTRDFNSTLGKGISKLMLQTPTKFIDIYEEWGGLWCDLSSTPLLLTSSSSSATADNIWQLGTNTEYPVLNCLPLSIQEQGQIAGAPVDGDGDGEVDLRDNDDDNDNIIDSLDQCDPDGPKITYLNLNGAKDWTSTKILDINSNGCRDIDEDPQVQVRLPEPTNLRWRLSGSSGVFIEWINPGNDFPFPISKIRISGNLQGLPVDLEHPFYLRPGAETQFRIRSGLISGQDYRIDLQFFFDNDKYVAPPIPFGISYSTDEEDDDDGDGVPNSQDACPSGANDLSTAPYSDIDLDGCRDNDEDESFDIPSLAIQDLDFIPLADSIAFSWTNPGNAGNAGSFRLKDVEIYYIITRGPNRLHYYSGKLSDYQSVIAGGKVDISLNTVIPFSGYNARSSYRVGFTPVFDTDRQGDVSSPRPDDASGPITIVDEILLGYNHDMDRLSDYDDNDDDNDGKHDNLDHCPRGVINWTRDIRSNDLDNDGCHDAWEDPYLSFPGSRLSTLNASILGPGMASYRVLLEWGDLPDTARNLEVSYQGYANGTLLPHISKTFLVDASLENTIVEGLLPGIEIEFTVSVIYKSIYAVNGAYGLPLSVRQQIPLLPNSDSDRDGIPDEYDYFFNGTDGAISGSIRVLPGSDWAKLSWVNPPIDHNLTISRFLIGASSYDAHSGEFLASIEPLALNAPTQGISFVADDENHYNLTRLPTDRDYVFNLTLYFRVGTVLVPGQTVKSARYTVSGDTDNDNILDVFDIDSDSDGVGDGSDNCPKVPNVSQNDNDNDSVGDICDLDDNGNGLIEIKTFEELNKIRENLEGTAFGEDTTGCIPACKGYELMNDISFTSRWVPITGERGFSAIFDGNGYSFLDYWFHLPFGTEGHGGFFAHVTGNAEIRNLHLVTSESVSRGRHPPGQTCTGSLVGLLDGNAQVIGSSVKAYRVFVVTSFDNSRLGGLIGCMHDNSKVISSSVEAHRVAGRRNVGGLVGFANGPGVEIIDSFAKTSEISGKDRMGGLLGGTSILNGQGIKRIARSYAYSGEIEKPFSLDGESSYLGGLVGRLRGIDPDQVVLDQSYAVNREHITADRNAAGLVGLISNGDIRSSFSLSTKIESVEAGGLVSEAIDADISSSYVFSKELRGHFSAGLASEMDFTNSKYINISNSYARTTQLYGGFDFSHPFVTQFTEQGNGLPLTSPHQNVRINDSYWDFLVQGYLSADDSPHFGAVGLSPQALTSGIDSDLGQIYDNWDNLYCSPATGRISNTYTADVFNSTLWDLGSASEYPGLNCMKDISPAEQRSVIR